MTQVDVYNRALGLARARAHLATTADAGEPAYQCNLWYDQVRKVALRAAHWRFARSQMAPTLAMSYNTADSPTLAGNPPLPYLYGYTPPTDLIAALYLIPNPPAVGGVQIFPNVAAFAYVEGADYAPRFELQTVTVASTKYQLLLSNALSPTLVYTYDATDPTLWDPMFDSVVTNGLAAYLAQAMTGDMGLAQLRLKTANDILIEARVADANEQTTTIDGVPDWMQIRGVVDYSPGTIFPPFGPLLGLA